MKRSLFSKNQITLIAELSANHNGSLQHAKKLIKLAKKSGADIVKFQTYSPDTMTIKSNRREFKIKNGLWKGSNLWELYSKGQTPLSWHKELFLYAKSLKIPCFSSPFDIQSVDFLEKLKCPYYKIASNEITHYPLIKKVSKTKKPVIISTGMSNLKEVEKAYFTAKKNGASEIILLYCVSNYPADFNDFNLENIRVLKNRFKCKVGFSDHSVDNRIAMSAITAGADIVEKHFALKNQKRGLDVDFSVKGNELKIFKDDMKLAYQMRGKPYFYVSKKERKNIKFRRSIYVTQNIKKGEKFSEKNLKVIRPNFGLCPSFYESLLGKKSSYNLKKNTPLNKKALK